MLFLVHFYKEISCLHNFYICFLGLRLDYLNLSKFLKACIYFFFRIFLSFLFHINRKLFLKYRYIGNSLYKEGLYFLFRYVVGVVYKGGYKVHRHCKMYYRNKTDFFLYLISKEMCWLVVSLILLYKKKNTQKITLNCFMLMFILLTDKF